VYAIPPDEMGGVISIGGLAVAKLFGDSSAVAASMLIAVAGVFKLTKTRSVTYRMPLFPFPALL